MNESIFIADFAGKCIREKVMMEMPVWKGKTYMEQPYITGNARWECFCEDQEEYRQHLASRRSYPYPVSKEQDGKELREGKDFEIKRQCYAKRGGSCELDLMTGNCECGIIAIPIEPDTPLQPVKDERLHYFREGYKYYRSFHAKCTYDDIAENTVLKAFNELPPYPAPPEPSSKEQEGEAIERQWEQIINYCQSYEWQKRDEQLPVMIKFLNETYPLKTKTYE